MALYSTRMRKKRATSYRLSPECLRLIAQSAERLGLPRASIMEIAIRALVHTPAGTIQSVLAAIPHKEGR